MTDQKMYVINFCSFIAGATIVLSVLICQLVDYNRKALQQPLDETKAAIDAGYVQETVPVSYQKIWVKKSAK